MKSTLDSIAFMIINRKLLNDNIINEIEDAKLKKQISKFLLYEASDYEILYLSIYGKLPEETYNLQNEKKLYKTLKNELTENYNFYSKFVGEKYIDRFISKVNVLSSLNSGIIFNIMEGTQGKDAEAMKIYLKELDDVINEEYKNIIKLKSIYRKKYGPNVSQWPTSARAKIKWAEQTRERFIRHRDRLIRDFNINNANAQTTPIKKSIKSSINAFLKTRGGKIVGITILLAMIGYAGYVIYKKYLSAAARYCKKYTGHVKEECMRRYKNKGIEARIKVLRDNMTKCNQTKNPFKCKSNIEKEITKLKRKIK